MNKKTIVKIFGLLSIIGFLFLIYFIFAQLSPEKVIENQDLIEFKKINTFKIIDTLKQEFAEEKNNLACDSSYFDIREQAALVILKEATKINSMQYLLTTIGKDGIEFTLKIANLIISKDPSLIIKEIEKMSVNQAKEYAMDWLLQNEMKVAKGNLDLSYPAYNGGWEANIFPYIVVYRPIDSEHGQVAIGIYSSRITKTPEPSLKYQWEGGIDRLPPFIVDVTGEVEKSKETNDRYRWIKGPEINIIFDQPVPEFEFKEPGFFKKIENYLNKIKTALGKIGDLGKGIIDDIFSFFSNPDSDLFEASIGQEALSLLERDQTQEESVFEQKDKELIERGLEKILKPSEDLSEKELEEFEELIDDLAEKIDILSEQIAKLVGIEGEGIEDEGTDDSVKIELASETFYKDPDQDQISQSKLENGLGEEEEEEEEEQASTPTTIRRWGGAPAPSYCLITGTGEPLMDKVIFNEIAWMGTENSSNDEWMRLKNLTGEEIDLSNWQILDKDEQIKIIFETGSTISANGFYLLERTDDDSLPGITADLIYTGALNDNNEALYLFDQDCRLQDKVIANPDWPAGNKEERESMKRAEDLFWYTYEPGLEPEPEPKPKPKPKPKPEPEGSQEIIFNEIAWMGTRASSSDEWIELYNPNLEPVELLDWEMRFYPIGADEPRINTFSSLTETTTPVIDGLGYFLLERTNNDTISDIEADYIFKGALNDDGGILELRDSQDNLIDKIDGSEGWFAGDKDNKVSMEKIINSNEWANNNLIIYQGKDAENNQVWATPKAENSINPPTEIYKQLPFNDFDEINLAIQSSPYIVKVDLEVPEGKVLNIEPGVILKFYDRKHGISVNGTLKAIGTEDEKITFTSARDNFYPGSWNKIYFGPTSIDSEMNNVVIEYAGAEAWTEGRSGIRVDQSSIILRDSLVEYNMYAGIYLDNSNSLIDNVQFIENEIWCKECQNQFGSYGIVIRAEAPIIKNSLFKKNTAGIFIDDFAKPIIENNIFEENEKAVYINDASPYFSGNQAMNNEVNGVFVRGSIGQDTVWEADLPYIVDSSLSVFPDTVFTLKPGVIVKLYDQQSKISVDGTLKAIGTESEKIVFTSFKDDPYPGSWDKIYFGPTSIDSELSNVIIEYAGADAWTQGRSGIRVDQSSIILRNSLIEHNMYAGLILDHSGSLVENVQFLENETYCQECHNQYGGMGIGIMGGTPSIRNSLFESHRYGLYIRDEASPILENLIFGIGDEANDCNIYFNNQCLPAWPEP